ncbi:MAG: hypothetical protein OXF07_02905 [Rhodobacter sp.]|nr:hypothetical protein [Rhodobacter sp.]
MILWWVMLLFVGRNPNRAIRESRLTGRLRGEAQPEGVQQGQHGAQGGIACGAEQVGLPGHPGQPAGAGHDAEAMGDIGWIVGLPALLMVKTR